MNDYFAAIIDLILNSPDPGATLKRANELIDLAEGCQIQTSAVPQTEQRAAL
jgi:hypothetical protein